MIMLMHNMTIIFVFFCSMAKRSLSCVDGITEAKQSKRRLVVGTKGGCMASALLRTKMFDKCTLMEIKSALNAEIPVILGKFNALRKSQGLVDEYPSHLVGIVDVEWHIKVVCAAVRKRGKYLKKQFVSQDGGCAALVESPNETYIVDGILNRGFQMANRAGGEWRCHSATAADHADKNDGNWRHCILIKDRRIRCPGVHISGISTENLYMDKKGLLFFVNCTACIYRHNA
jgi:hypothetical protein